MKLKLPDDDPRKRNPLRGIGAPRAAVIAGLVGLIPVWIVGFVLYNAGYIDRRYKDVGTAVEVLCFVIPFVVVLFLHNRRTKRLQK